MPKFQYSEDRVRPKRNFEFLNIDLCSHDNYLQNEKNPNGIGWEMIAKCEIVYFMR